MTLISKPRCDDYLLPLSSIHFTLEAMKHMSPMGTINSYSSTYQHDYTGKRGENRNYTFYYQSSYSLSPNIASKPPFGRPITPGCGRPSGY